MKISDMTKTEIGEELMRLASLTGMKLPDDPPLTAHWIKKKYANYYAVLLREAFDWYCEGSLDLKSREVNAMNVSRILNTHMKTSKNRYYEAKVVSVAEVEASKQKQEEGNRKALVYAAEDYYRDIIGEDPKFRMTIVQLEALQGYVVEKGYVSPQEITEEKRDYIIGKLKRYAERKTRHIHEEVKSRSDFHAKTFRSFQGKDRNYDYERALVTAFLIEKRIEDGWKPKL